MILKVFKEKSNQKYINKLLNAKRVAIHRAKITSVGVILNVSEFSDFDAFQIFFKSLGLSETKIKMIAFVEDSKQSKVLWDVSTSPKDFGWKGKINNSDLLSFINTKFDVLISFYRQNHLELDVITASSKANFKVSLINEDERLYDLMIDVQTTEFNLFTTELKKYLTVLNKL